MFVPSLSWQNDHFYSNGIKNGAKDMRFPHLGLQLAPHERMGEERLKRGLRNVKTHLVSLENRFS